MPGIFLGALDQTFVSSSIYTIANNLPGLSRQAGASTTCLITCALTTPLYGKLSDIFGRRPPQPQRHFLAALGGTCPH